MYVANKNVPNYKPVFILVSLSGGPIEAVAQVSGNINGEEFGTTLLISNVSSEARGYSLVRARMYDIPATVGEYRALPSCSTLVDLSPTEVMHQAVK